MTRRYSALRAVGIGLVLQVVWLGLYAIGGENMNPHITSAWTVALFLVLIAGAPAIWFARFLLPESMPTWLGVATMCLINLGFWFAFLYGGSRWHAWLNRSKARRPPSAA